MVSFNYCETKEEYDKLTKNNDALYFVPGYGIFKGGVLCTEYNTPAVLELANIVDALADVVDGKLDKSTYNTKMTALDNSISSLTNSKINIANPAGTGTFTMQNTNGTANSKASLVYTGNALTLSLS